MFLRNPLGHILKTESPLPSRRKTFWSDGKRSAPFSSSQIARASRSTPTFLGFIRRQRAPFLQAKRTGYRLPILSIGRFISILSCNQLKSHLMHEHKTLFRKQRDRKEMNKSRCILSDVK